MYCLQALWLHLNLFRPQTVSVCITESNSGGAGQQPIFMNHSRHFMSLPLLQLLEFSNIVDSGGSPIQPLKEINLL